MPLITIRTGFRQDDDTEEILAEYVCDWPGCPNPGIHVLGCSRELRTAAVVCDAHARRDGPGATRLT